MLLVAFTLLVFAAFVLTLAVVGLLLEAGCGEKVFNFKSVHIRTCLSLALFVSENQGKMEMKRRKSA